MQAVSGYLSNGLFTPNDGAELPNHARVKLVIEEVLEKPQSAEIVPFKLSDAEREARLEGLKNVERLLELSRDENILLENFPKQGLMRVDYGEEWFDKD
ncbi:MAG: hypothetical protein FWB96_07005 [Defluviitaleaceae bacterium]|nr:hypothetical protein [Defluviitaleaceae bacterium]MCL2262983.1 hypothetical protein [Defluviitaleaceae bacterium]